MKINLQLSPRFFYVGALHTSLPVKRDDDVELIWHQICICLVPMVVLRITYFRPA